VTRRVDRDEEEPGREHNEEEAEKVALHPGSVVTASRTPRTVASVTRVRLSALSALPIPPHEPREQSADEPGSEERHDPDVLETKLTVSPHESTDR